MVGERVPPHNLDAELAVLGSMLLSPEAVILATGKLQPECFYHGAHSTIFEVAVELSTRKVPIDYVTMTDQLSAMGKLEDVGGAPFVGTLTDLVATAANVDHYVNLVLEKYTLRRLIEESSKIIQSAYEAVEMPEKILEAAEASIFAVAEQRITNNLVSVASLLDDTFAQIERMMNHGGELTGAPTGFIDLDRLTNGFQSSDLIILAGRPGMGKTSFGLNIAQNCACLSEDLTVAFFSLEMSRQQVVQRFLSAEARVDMSRLRTGGLMESDWGDLTRAAGVLHEAPLYIDDTPGISVLELKSKCRRLQAERGLGMVVVDYMQLMSAGIKLESRQQEISFISRSLKEMAKELNVPVIALSQLSRAVESRSGNVPQLSDLRESGSIEQDADMVLFLYRPEYYQTNEKAPDQEGLAELIIAKHRNGALATVQLAFLKRFTRFENCQL